MKPSGNIKSTHDFEPYGVELEPIGNDTTNFNYKFTGQERDTFTNYDYMHFRFYASSTGRFLKPDNIIPDITNPLNWNGYSYVKGNPINFNDPSGHETPDAVQQSVKTETSANVSNPPRSTDNNNEQMKKKLTAQPKKVGDDAFKFTLDVSGLTATAIGKSEEVKLSKAGNAAAKEWGLILKQSEFKIAGKLLGGASAALDVGSAFADVWKVRSMGTSLSKEERMKLYWDMAIGSALILAGAILEGPTITASSVLLVGGAFKVGTAIGKLINSGLPAIPDRAPQHINPREKIPDIPSQRFPGGYF